MSLSQKLYAEACLLMPGGVSSPVRAFGAVGGTPPFIVRAKGACLYDADGREYIDYVGSWGCAILGHAPDAILRTLNETMKNGLSFGMPTPSEILLAKKIIQHYPAIEKIRFVNSGTEAVMSALRVARGFTGRSKIIKFDGGYHGHADSLLVKAGSGVATCGLPDSYGVPEAFVVDTLVATYNDISSVLDLFKKHPQQFACVIIEPVFGNMGCILPQPDFLKELRKLCTQHGALLIFDEVMTGFRVALQSASGLFGIRPDLVTLGKIIGGGLPVGAYGGRADIMNLVAPLGPVYQAGTLSGNPLAMSVGVKTIEILAKGHVYRHLEQLGRQLETGFLNAAKKQGVPLQFNRLGGMFSFFFSKNFVGNAQDARRSDKTLFNKVFHSLLLSGIYLAPSAFEAGFLSFAHTPEHIQTTISAFELALTKL